MVTLDIQALIANNAQVSAQAAANGLDALCGLLQRNILALQSLAGQVEALTPKDAPAAASAPAEAPEAAACAS